MKKNPKAFFKYARSKLKARTRVSDLLLPGGEILTSDRDKANILNEFFASVFTQEGEDELPPFPEKTYESDLDNIYVDTNIVLKKLEKLNVNKSCGPDDMHPRMLYEMREVIAEPLADLFKASLKCGTLPEDWKTGHITPIIKKGAKKNNQEITVRSA